MATTIETMAERLKKLEGEVQQLHAQLKQLLAEQPPMASPASRIRFIDKEKLRSLTAETFQKMGIDNQPIGAENVQQMIADCGVKPEDNLFSRGVIEMREE
jgi:7-keto-8-aminopelargonate synthetase-like enzyme